jgi:isochorismate synthase EntC
MAWQWLGVVAKHVPWGEIVRRTPEILAASAGLLERQKALAQRRKDPAQGSKVEQLETQLLELKARDLEHAEVIEQMAAQLRELSIGMEVLAARIRLLAWMLAGAIIVALTSLALTLG